jgi:hypothetical protein
MKKLLSTKTIASCLFLAASAVTSPAWPAYVASDYFPLPDGALWSYSGPMGDFSSWVVAGEFDVDGTLTKRIDDSDGGSEFYTNNENGIFLHRVDVNDIVDGIEISAEVRLDPPIPLANAVANLGESLISSGLAYYDLGNDGIWPISYESTATIHSVQETQAPYGTFDTIYMTVSLTLSGTILWQDVYSSETEHLYLAPGIGPVRIGNPSTGEFELVSSNIEDLFTVDTVGFYAPITGKFYLKNSHAGGAADTAFRFGPANAGWLPITGDWDNDGVDTVGLYDPIAGNFYLKNSHAGGAADASFRFGPADAGWLPITGDWDNDGVDTVGLYDPIAGKFYLKNSHAGGAADTAFRFGPANAGWLPITGNWDNDGMDTVGFYDPIAGKFYLKNSHAGGAADTAFRFGPANAGWLPITGDWN